MPLYPFIIFLHPPAERSSKRLTNSTRTFSLKNQLINDPGKKPPDGTEIESTAAHSRATCSVLFFISRRAAPLGAFLLLCFSRLEEQRDELLQSRSSRRRHEAPQANQLLLVLHMLIQRPHHK